MMKNTPVEKYEDVYVKREDLCGGDGAPTFSKIRGIYEYLNSLKDKGIMVVGYTETSISMAGWGVAWACSLLGMTAVLFDPQYKVTPELLVYHRSQWAKHKAVVIPIKAGMAKVNYYISRRMMKELYPDKAWRLLPLGLPFKETIEATSEQLRYTRKNQLMDTPQSIVVNIGSGTICAGLLKHLNDIKYDGFLYGIMGRTGSVEGKKNQIIGKANLIFNNVIFVVVDHGWEYTEKSEVECPFPCHPYYDLKAWEWLVANKEYLPKPILFWNIGH